jgi:anti-anti-sigma factor
VKLARALSPFALRRHEGMKSAAREWGKLAVCLSSFDAVFRENQANCQFALPFSEGEMEISERKVGKVTVIKIQGQAVIDQQPERLSQLARERLQAGDRLFVVNLAGCSRMDSTALGELVKSQKMVADCEGVMKLAEVPLNLRGLFIVTNLTQILEIFDREQQAINSFGA